jgi:O-methyltransferase involved in polyketide biosynthesis
VVILGSGLDTWAERKRADRRRLFEIDDTSTLDFKKAPLAANGFDARLNFIPGNYVA